jgi:valyl-tRNA synthetase
MAFMQEAISAVRNLRKQLNLNPGARVNLAIRVAEDRQKELFARYAAYFAKLAKVDDLDVARDLAKPPASIAAVVRNVEIFLPLKGLVDFDAERARLAKQIEKLEKELAGINAKLNNQNFLNNAKAEVVENERQRLAETGTKLSLTKDLLADLE